MDRWDLEAVDPAILYFARLATPEKLVDTYTERVSPPSIRMF